MTETTYAVTGRWRPDRQTPAEIGARFLQTLDRLKPLSPIMNNWIVADFAALKAVPIAEARSEIATLVEKGVSRDEHGTYPNDGYNVFARGGEIESEFGRPRCVDVDVDAASDEGSHAAVEVNCTDGNLDLITYPLYRGALEVLVSTWPCPWAEAYVFVPNLPPLVPFAGLPGYPPAPTPQPRETYIFPWILYLSAAMADGLVPPAGVASEQTPGGGWILSATKDRFDPDNPNHMRATRILQGVVAKQLGRYRPYPTWALAYPPPRVGPY